MTLYLNSDFRNDCSIINGTLEPGAHISMGPCVNHISGLAQVGSNMPTQYPRQVTVSGGQPQCQTGLGVKRTDGPKPASVFVLNSADDRYYKDPLLAWRGIRLFIVRDIY